MFRNRNLMFFRLFFILKFLHKMVTVKYYLVLDMNLQLKFKYYV